MAILSAVALVLQISMFQQNLIPAAAAKAAEPAAAVASAAAPAPATPAASLPATPIALPDAPQPVAASAAEPSAALPSANAAAPNASAAPTPASLTGIYIAPDQNLLESKPSIAPVEASKRTWLALSITEHTAAAFDAWTTRRSIESGNVEVDPLLKPFANSDAVYGAIQGTPIMFDFLSRRMQRSDSRLIRRFWWVPQAAMASVSIYSGAHNMSITR